MIIKQEVKTALEQKKGVVALESAVITHGLPRPENFETAQAMENSVRSEGSTPATICLLSGKIKVGLTNEELKELSIAKDIKKISIKDIAGAKNSKLNGGTTVAATITIAHLMKIPVFATGGIGGVHRGSHFDISADLPALSINPILVVCSGAKSILDLAATREYLETMAIPVVGYQTDDFPAFYSQSSGLAVDFKMNSIEEIVEFSLTHWSLGLQSAVLVVVPPPSKTAMPKETIDMAISQALIDAEKNHISGSDLTPYLLTKINEITYEKSMTSNIALLINNAQIAGKIATCMEKKLSKES